MDATSEKLIKILENFKKILSKHSDKTITPELEFIKLHIENPSCYIGLVGETSSGKSTLINSFLEKKVLVSRAIPTTGTVTCIEYNKENSSSENNYYAIYRDALSENITRDEFLDLSENPIPDLLRLQVNVFATKKEFSGLTIFDTPGFNSLVSEHEEILKEFLPDSDIILFVISYRVGFGENDQNLMYLIYDIIQHFGNIPVILVVNRVPAGTDKNNNRIKEILYNAENTINSKLNDKLFLIETSKLDENGYSTLPNTTLLWNEVAKIAFSEKRKIEINRKVKILISGLLNKHLANLEGNILSIQVGDDAINVLNELLNDLNDREERSYEIVNKYMELLHRQLPNLLEAYVKELQIKLKNEIYNSSKWTEINLCASFVSNHVLPFGIKQIGKKIEEYVGNIFTQMDEELSELANDTIRKIENRASTIDNPELSKLLLNLCGRFITSLAGDLSISALKGLGGVGGIAAGTGNLAKKIVKEVGSWFGKKFSKEVYTNIGKIFTKRFVNNLTSFLQIAIEVASYFWESTHWQDDLLNKSNDAIIDWKNKALIEIKEKMIPEYSKENMKNVEETYIELKNTVKEDISKATQHYTNSQTIIDGLNVDIKFINNLKEQLNSIQI